jgi:hypothetical protein
MIPSCKLCYTSVQYLSGARRYCRSVLIQRTTKYETVSLKQYCVTKSRYNVGHSLCTSDVVSRNVTCTYVAKFCCCMVNITFTYLKTESYGYTYSRTYTLRLRFVRVSACRRIHKDCRSPWTSHGIV